MPTERRFSQNIANSLPILDYRRELFQSLERINTYNPPVHTCSTGWSFSGFYSGPTSIAYLFYRLSIVYPNLVFKQQSLLEWADDYLKLSQHSRHNPPDPNHCGVASETLAYEALTSIINNDSSLATKVCSYETDINSDVGSNEWLYGRAGYLYILRLCRTHFEKQSDMEKVRVLLDRTIDRTIQYIHDIPRPWTWHGKEYLGAVHGYIGIITQIVLSQPENKRVQADARLEAIMTDLLNTQMQSGNFSSSAEKLGADKDDRLVQICHGSPGFVMSFDSIKSFFSEGIQAKIQQATERARDDIWNRGVLTKPPCLCHGIAGNALAFTRHDDGRFEGFLGHITTEQLESNAKADLSKGLEKGWLQDAGRSDSFSGLFTGEAGRAWVWAVADKNLPRTCIGYNDV